MDAPNCDRRRLAEALDALGGFNRFFGGNLGLTRHVLRLLRGRTPGRVRILDVGAGGGDAIMAVARAVARRGWRPWLMLADRHEVTLELCRDRITRAIEHWGESHGRPELEVAFVRLDGTALPFADDEFDRVISTATLHHLSDAEAPRFVSELARVARLGCVLSDLRRSRATYLGARALAATAWRRLPFPRVDGPISVLRSFTPGEVRVLLRRAGVGEADVRRGPIRWAARVRPQ